MDNNSNITIASIESLSPRPTLIPNIDPMEFLSRSWSDVSSINEVSKAINPHQTLVGSIPEDAIGELQEDDHEEGQVFNGNPFTFATSAASQLVLERIMSHSQDISSLTTGRLSHSSGPLNGGGSLSDSPPVSPSEIDDFCRANNSRTPHYRSTNKTVGRWLKERREKKKEETRTQNAQLHAAVSVAGVAAAVAAIATATAAASGPCKDDRVAKADAAVASAATFVASQCIHAAEALGAEPQHLASVVGSAVSVSNAGDVITLTAAAATALRGAATLKARALKEVWNIAAVIPVDKGHREQHHRHNHQQKPQEKKDDDDGSIWEISNEENFLGQCGQELLARGTELLKRTRKGALHWKLVYVYIHRTGAVMLKMKSRHVAGTITKKKKRVVTDICRDTMAWPGRHLLEGGEDRRYFGLKTAEKRVIEFECRSQREYDMWTKGVARLLSIVRENRRVGR